MQKTTSRRSVASSARSRKVTATHREARLAKREMWLRDIDPDSLFHRLFDVIPGVYFFAKNREGELMFLSRSNRELRHLADDAAVIGLTDFDLNPVNMARSFVEDDARIRATGKPMLNRVELWFDPLGMPDWFVVNKMPIRSRSGAIIGVMGFSQSYEGRAKLLEPSEGLTKAVNHIREKYGQGISLVALARLAGLSPRQLERRFKAAFGVGPRHFLIKTRLLAGCRLLRGTQQGMAEIAYACGFSDQSAFARDFRRHVGMTPSEFRCRASAP
jgi:AraC-like DNA-binding protein